MQNSAQVIIGYQGTRASFSEAAVKEYFAQAPTPAGPLAERPFKPFPFDTFAGAIAAFYTRHEGSSRKPNLPDELLLPIRNNNSRRVTAMQRELPGLRGWIAGEYYLLVEQCLLVNKGVEFDNVSQVWSMEPAIDQVRQIIEKRNLVVVYKPDTAKAANELKKSGRRDAAAIASPEAATVYGLDNLGNACDNLYNYTHFLHVVHPKQIERFLPDPAESEACITKVVLEGDLYPDLGTSPFEIFTKNGVRVFNPVDADVGHFDHRTTILDLKGHFKSEAIADCMRELKKHGYKMRITGCYRRHIIPPENQTVRTRIAPLPA